MLYVNRVGEHGGIHHLGCIEGVSAPVNRRYSVGGAENVIVDISVDRVEFSGLVPVVGRHPVRILGEEGLDIVCCSEFLVELVEIVGRCLDIRL